MNQDPKILFEIQSNCYLYLAEARPILATAIMLAISISLWIENNRRADETNKFLILRGFYPDVAKYIDSAYTANADFFIKKAKSNIDEQQNMSEAAFEAKQSSIKASLALIGLALAALK